jgi:fluoride exporter
VHYALVFIGGGIGAALRHGVNRASLALIGPGYPAGTVIVNIVGSFLMGALASWFAHRVGHSQALRLFLTTGILGGFTTFSAFSLDTAVMWERGDYGGAAVYVVASVVISIAGLFAGLAVTRAIL